MDFNKKCLGIPLGVILLLVVIATVTAASLVVVYETTLTGQVTVEETTSDNNYEIKIYKTKSCEQEISSIDFGSIKPGEGITLYIWIKNTGDSYIPEFSYPRIRITADEGWHKYNTAEGTLEPGEAKRCSIVVSTEPDTPPGDYSGEIKIVARAENSQ